jgi:hypothetical protein
MIGQAFLLGVFIGMAIGIMAMAIAHHHSGVPAWKATALEWLVDDAEDIQLFIWQMRERVIR